jgi:hypothetical protein
MAQQLSAERLRRVLTLIHEGAEIPDRAEQEHHLLTLEEVVEHYALFFQIATDTNIDGDPPLVFTAQDKADLLAFLNLL